MGMRRHRDGAGGGHAATVVCGRGDGRAACGDGSDIAVCVNRGDTLVTAVPSEGLVRGVLGSHSRGQRGGRVTHMNGHLALVQRDRSDKDRLDSDRDRKVLIIIPVDLCTVNI